MHNLYLSTFVTGFSQVVKNNLPKHIRLSKIDLLLDSLVVYQTSTEPKKLNKINYLNNTFLILKRFTRDKNLSVDSLLKNVLSDTNIFKVVSQYIQKSTSFRVVVSQENHLIAVDNRLLKRLEDKLSQNKNLKPNRLKPDIEFWLLMRSEGVAFFCLRLSKKPNQEKYLEKGELRPELASLLCLVSEPQNNDILLYQFSGYGPIPIQRLFIPNIKYQEIIASDKDPGLVADLKSKLKQLQKKKSVKNFTIKNFDALDLKPLPDGVINKIVTDPPWGLKASHIGDIQEFQHKMLDEFCRVLDSNGLLVILTKKEIFDQTLQKYSPKFKFLNEYTTLVAGQKASVYKFKKNS